MQCDFVHHGEHGDHNVSGMIVTAQRLVNAVPAVVASRRRSGHRARPAAGHRPRAGVAMSILDRFAVTDQVAVVTGAGRGIGAATAIAFAEAGADVVISSRTQNQLDQVAERIRATGRRALVVPADLSDTDAVAGLAQAAYDEFGRLDTVVNNVGGTIPNAFLDTDVAYLEEAFHFNVSTAHALSLAAVPLMLQGRRRAEVHRQHQLDDGPGLRARVPGLRHRQGGARALGPAGGGRPRAAGSGSTGSSSAR